MVKNRQFAGLIAVLVSVVAMLGCASDSATSARNEQAAGNTQLEPQKRARIRLQLAIGYYQQKQMQIALEEIRQAIQADPALADAYAVGALIYMDLGENRLAEEYFQRAISLDRSNPDYSNNYGWFLCQNGRERQSIAYFEAAIENKAYQSRGKALANAGACALRMKDTVTAERYLLRAFQDEPGNAGISTNLAQIFYERRDYPRARFYVARVTNAEAPTPEALWLAVRIERKLGDKPAENSLATQLRRRFPDSPEATAYQRGAFDE